MQTAGVVGGGPAGLIAAEVLARAGVAVTVHDRMPSVSRKLLLAGHGGLNITHSEPLDRMLPRYGAAAERLAPMIEAFTPDDLRAWCAGLGEATFVGSSGRVFPRSFRATPLVRAWLTRLDSLGVTIHKRQRWTGWTADGAGLTFTGVGAADDGTRTEASYDVVLLALGGASWPRLGSDGSWVDLLAARGVAAAPLRAANVGARVAWTAGFAERFQGVPLKHVAVSVRGQDQAPVRGDAMVTRTGIEGGPLYATGAAVRAALDADGRAVLLLDLRPDQDAARLADRLARRRPKDSRSTWLQRSLGLDPVAVGLLREATGNAVPDDPAAVAALIKAVPVVVTEAMPIEKAISSAGGIRWSEVDDDLALRALPGTFVAGEMLDWEAPTGGYLLQASYATGVAAARGMLARLGVAGAASAGPEVPGRAGERMTGIEPA
ncbi:TIGR03862 family flavoprotein [Cellulomonas triticagri]|uniref:TIGR03862 family flavoprotein n=1 Tax=Cellulomonas triticagri TaxID=2483352 RepID=A0A3M2JVH9_9CELL|nr:TIGR03862 family flavoprotein [Cellulomonas triticagri]RMI14058.1 TIGR03862 family flavoprotein [Cellulomonas triticagri]